MKTSMRNLFKNIYDQEVFQKFILGGGSFYKISNRDIFVDFLCNIVKFL